MNDEHHDDVIDSTAEEVGGGSLEVAAPAPSAVPMVAPQVTAAELGGRLQVIQETMEQQMEEGVDYGKVPGTDKPTLFKPGAEKLSVLFRLDVQPRSEKIREGEHLTVMTAATVFDIATGARLGFGEGMCSSREKKYGKRKQDRTCPQCKAATIKRSKYPPRDHPGAEPGWYCFDRLGGCGANFDAEDPDIIGQEVGDVVNPDLPDTWNTIVKMAEKRARVDAVLAVTGASAIFTQDLDEEGDATGSAGALAPVTEEQKAKLAAALRWLLPPTEAERVWGEVKGQFGGQLYGPVAEAVLAPVSALKAIHDDEQATEQEAKEGEAEEAERAQAAAEDGDEIPSDPDAEPEPDPEPPAEKKPPAKKPTAKGRKKS